MAELKPNPAYRHIDIDVELGKMDAWLLTPKGARGKKTRAFVVRWLNEAADRQREVSHVSQLINSHAGCTAKVPASNGRTYVLCGNPIAEDQASLHRPLCSSHLLYRQQIDAQLQNGGTA